MRTRMRAHTRVRACVRAYAHTRVHTRARACVRTQAYAHTRVHAHARTRTCAHTCAQLHPKCSVKFRAFYTGSSRVRACVRAYAHVYISRVCPFGTHTPIYRNTRAHTRARIMKKGVENSQTVFPRGCLYTTTETISYLRGFSRYTFPQGAKYPEDISGHIMPSLAEDKYKSLSAAALALNYRGGLYTTDETISYLRGFSRYTFPQGAKYPEDIPKGQ